MKGISVLYGGRLADEAFEKILSGREGERESAFYLALAAASRFPGVQRTVFFGLEGLE